VCPKRDDKPFVFRNVIVYSSPLKGSFFVRRFGGAISLSLKEKKNSLSLSFFFYI
jgi:hypothetical protein